MRASGILFPVSSIPSRYGIGSFSREAYKFVDQLESAGQSYWQILPLGPTGYGDSPYQSFSTFAGNPYLIDLEDLIEKGLLMESECSGCDWGGSESYVDYEKMYQSRFLVLKKAFSRFDPTDAAFLTFKNENAEWLDDYCTYMAIKNDLGGILWTEWPEELKNREKQALKEAKERLFEEREFYAFQQFFFDTQWTKLKAYANEKGIQIIGDVPIYVAFDSADTWADPELFQFDETHQPKSVAGCPPDAFSVTGQLWGNPVYDWKYHKKTNYAWWIRRMENAMKRYNVARIDHFRGFEAYYAIPYGDKTAENGKWEKGPGAELFHVLKKKIPDLQVIAEDLGVITDEVREMMAETGFPGMKVLQFAFDESEASVYLPYRFESSNCVVYTGTHDNETTKGWLEGLEKQQGHGIKFVREYINCYQQPVNDCVWALIRTAMSSTADLAIIPLQDYLCLGNEARINEPSTLGNNWKWRLTKGLLSDTTLYHIREITRIYGRNEMENAFLKQKWEEKQKKEKKEKGEEDK